MRAEFEIMPLRLKEDTGQMAVELAVLVPVIIVVVLIVVNVLEYASLCARFDRVSYNAVLVAGISPEASSESLGMAEAVHSQIVSAMDSDVCDIEVATQTVALDDSGALINLAAGTTRYVCTLVFHPWPLNVSIAGASLTLPFEVRHTRELVVDQYRSAIVV